MVGQKRLATPNDHGDTARYFQCYGRLSDGSPCPVRVRATFNSAAPLDGRPVHYEYYESTGSFTTVIPVHAHAASGSVPLQPPARAAASARFAQQPNASIKKVQQDILLEARDHGVSVLDRTVIPSKQQLSDIKRRVAASHFKADELLPRLEELAEATGFKYSFRLRHQSPRTGDARRSTFGLLLYTDVLLGVMEAMSNDEILFLDGVISVLVFHSFFFPPSTHNHPYRHLECS